MSRKIVFFLICFSLVNCKSQNVYEDNKKIIIEKHLKKPFNCIENINGRFSLCYETIKNEGLEPDLAKKMIVIDLKKDTIVFTDRLLLESASWIDDRQIKILSKSTYAKIEKKETGYIYNVVLNKKVRLGYEKI